MEPPCHSMEPPWTSMEPLCNSMEPPCNSMEPPWNFMEPPYNSMEPPWNSMEPPYFYLRKVKPRKLVFCNTTIVVVSSIFASLQLSGISMDIYMCIDIHLHTTFPLAASTLAFLGIFIVLRKRARVDFQRQTSKHQEKKCCSNGTKICHNYVHHFACFVYFPWSHILQAFFWKKTVLVAVIKGGFSCCENRQWYFFSLIQQLTPFLTTFRMNELKLSVKIVLRLGRQDNLNSYANCRQPSSLANVVPI